MGRLANALKVKQHRLDIDGLRALAVLLVVAFHMNPRCPPGIAHWIGVHLSHTLEFDISQGKTDPNGGFIGVDVFFVISGFLISGILLREQENQSFSLARFYERRIRRILPALTVVLLFTFFAGYACLIPPEMVDLGKTLLAATLSAANIYFWKNSGYFDNPAFSRPLLHTWSLAVEEQFYLVFPVFLLLMRRFFNSARTLKIVIVVVAAISFAASVAGVYRSPTATFYLPQTRAWELLLGTIAAMEIVPPPASRLDRNLAAWVGFILIVFSGFRADQTNFPGLGAVAPCLGAMLIIMAGVTGNSFIGRILSARPIVFVGAISYSLYLWHWPLLLINRYEYFPGIHMSLPWLFVVMLITSTLSWRFVEQPFRTGPFKPGRVPLFIMAAAASAVFVLLGVLTITTHGFPTRFTQDDLRLAAYETAPIHWNDGCFVSADLGTLAPRCLTQSAGQQNYLLFGDSHAADLWLGLSTSFPSMHLAQATGAFCKPLPTSRLSKDKFCRDLVHTVFDEFLPAHRGEAIILSCDWALEDLPRLSEMVAALNAAKYSVYVVGPIPSYDQPLPDLLIRARKSGDEGLPDRHLYPPDGYKWLDDHLEENVVSKGASHYISLRRIICPASRCLGYASPGMPMLFDRGHATEAGSLFIGQQMRSAGELD